MRRSAREEPISATALNPIIGYDRAAKLIKEALAKKASVKQLAIDQGLITKEHGGQGLRLPQNDRAGETGVGAG